MKTFNEIYQELQNPDNNELHSVWKKVKMKSERANKIAAIICLMIDIFAIIMFYKNGINNPSAFFIVIKIIWVLLINLFTIVMINNLITNKEKNKYSQTFKKVIVNKIMNNFYDNLEYFPQEEMPQYIYDEPEYKEYYNIYESEDYFRAQIKNKYNIQMAEVLTQEKEQYTNSKGEKQTRIITKFHGLFAKIIINKSINSEIKIMQNRTFLFNKRLKMDSSEFEKYFDVQASNHIIGMQLLTADIMEELVKFENEMKVKFDIYINNNQLYLRFHSGEMFEAGKIKNAVFDKKITQKYFSMLNFTYNLSTKLIDVINDTYI